MGYLPSWMPTGPSQRPSQSSAFSPISQRSSGEAPNTCVEKKRDPESGDCGSRRWAWRPWVQSLVSLVLAPRAGFSANPSPEGLRTPHPAACVRVPDRSQRCKSCPDKPCPCRGTGPRDVNAEGRSLETPWESWDFRPRSPGCLPAGLRLPPTPARPSTTAGRWRCPRFVTWL